MAAKETIFDGFIKLTENLYIKPCDAQPSAYDLYQYKPSTSPRHPEGKMSDIAFGLTLERAINWACHHEATSQYELKTLNELIIKLSEVNQEIFENMQSFIND